MIRSRHTVLMSLLLPTIFLGASTHASPPSLNVQANRGHIYLGESIVLTVRAEGVRDAPEPDMGSLKNCNIQFLGSHKESRSFFGSVNGRIQRIVSSGRTFTYAVTPKQTGKFIAGPISVNLRGKKLTVPGPMIEVVGVDEQDLVLLTVEVSAESVLVDEPFDVVLSVLLKRLPKPYQNIPPIDPNSPPLLQATYLDVRPLDGLESPDIRDELRRHLVERQSEAGFTINNYTVRRDPFDFNSAFPFDGFGNMGRPKKAKFMFDHQPVTRGGKDYFRYSLSLRYIPSEEGSHTFGPVEFKGSIILGADRTGQPKSRSIFAIGPAATVRVIPPPEDDRPTSYIGAVGTNFETTASLDAQTCKVGDPLTLTLTFAGDFRKENIFPPPLAEQHDLGRDFKIYEDTIRMEPTESGKSYSYTIRPTSVGTYEFPGVSASYYDTRLRRYVTVTTRPIPIRANPSEEVDTDDIVGASTNGPRRKIQSDVLTIAPLTIPPTGCDTTNLAGSPIPLAAAAAAPVVYAVFLLIHALQRHAPQRTRQRKSHLALRLALDTLLQAHDTPRTSDPSAHTLLATTLRQYLMDRFHARAGITHSDAHTILTQHNVDPADIEKFCTMMEQHSNAGFGAAHAEIEYVLRDIAAAGDMLKRIHKTTTPKRAFSRAAKTAGVITVILASSYSCLANNILEKRFVWDEATSIMLSAKDTDDFLAAARTYRKLADLGARNGPLFYNIGTACLLADNHEEARFWLERSERYVGGEWSIRRNLLLAYSKADSLNATIPWYRVLLFWHYGLACPIRTLIACVAFVTVWISLVFRSLGISRLFKVSMTISLVVLVLFGTSVAASLHAEALDCERIRITEDIVGSTTAEVQL